MWGPAAEPRKKKRQRALLLGLLEALRIVSLPSSKKYLFYYFGAVVLCFLKSLFLKPIIPLSTTVDSLTPQPINPPPQTSSI